MGTDNATGNCVRWLPDDPVTGNRWLRLTSSTKRRLVVHEYEVEEVVPRYKYRLWRLDPATFQLVCRNVTLSAVNACDCEDATHRRPGQCKHVRGLRAALDVLPF